MNNLLDSTAWKALKQHHADIHQLHMRDLFSHDPKRHEQMLLKTPYLTIDYARHRVTAETMRLLNALATERNLDEKLLKLFQGHPVNTSENQAALHTELRSSSTRFIQDDRVRIKITQAIDKIKHYIDDLNQGRHLSASKKPFKHIVNVGVGGSHAGVALTLSALKAYCRTDMTAHCLSGIDPQEFTDLFQRIRLDETLFIISSKSFKTVETLCNAKSILALLRESFGEEGVRQQVLAVTADPSAPLRMGIKEDHLFEIWNWVGGRYSIWSAIALPLMIMIGMPAFSEFLSGAEAMDEQVLNAPHSENAPRLLALLDIWYQNFFHSKAHAIIPYPYALRHLIPYLQQAEMESNGKSVSLSGEPISYSTGNIIFGQDGITGQHTYHQLLFQGTHLIPADFILVNEFDPNAHEPLHADAVRERYALLNASAVSQANALMQGLTIEECKQFDGDQVAPHKVISGNQPSTIISLAALTPKHLGNLIALYEHRIFIKSAIWNINPFDQWGVELGKSLLPNILHSLSNQKTS